MMKRFLVGFSLLSLGVIGYATIATSAAIVTGTVNGSVTQSGNPVEGARVVIESQSDSTYGAAMHTDAKGAFSFSGAPLGGVSLRVYDANDQLVVSGKGELTFQGEVITLTLEIAP